MTATSPPSTKVSEEGMSSPRILLLQKGTLSVMRHIVRVESSEMVAMEPRRTSKSNAMMG